MGQYYFINHKILCLLFIMTTFFSLFFLFSIDGNLHETAQRLVILVLFFFSLICSTVYVLKHLKHTAYYFFSAHNLVLKMRFICIFSKKTKFVSLKNLYAILQFSNIFQK